MVFMCSIIIMSYRKLHTYVLWYLLNRKVHPCMGSKAPLLLHSQYICCKYIIEDRENPKLFLSHTKVKILINSWHFLMLFLDVPCPPFDWHPQFSINETCYGGTQSKQVLAILDLQFLRFKFSNVFVPVETVILGCFWIVFWPNLPKICQFCLNCWPVMTCKMMHHICYSFYCSIKKWSKLSQKADF